MSVTIRLPRLLGTRETARLLVSKAGDLNGQTVVLQCRDVLSASHGFIDEIVRQTLVDGGAERLALRAPPQQMQARIRGCAVVHSVWDRVHVLRPGEDVEGEE